VSVSSLAIAVRHPRRVDRRPVLDREWQRAAAVTVGIGLVVASLTACVTREDAKKLVQALQSQQQPSRPDVLPVMLNREVPVHYPPALYSRKAQGNVVLRIFIDSTGHVHPESTVVAQSSGEPAFDSAAIDGVVELRFAPARRHGVPVAVSVLFPIYFRHPEGPPVPGDSVLRRGTDTGAAAGSAATDQAPGQTSQHADSGRR
jgi:TonB family protein